MENFKARNKKNCGVEDSVRKEERSDILYTYSISFI